MSTECCSTCAIEFLPSDTVLLSVESHTYHHANCLRTEQNVISTESLPTSRSPDSASITPKQQLTTTHLFSTPIKTSLNQPLKKNKKRSASSLSSASKQPRAANYDNDTAEPSALNQSSVQHSLEFPHAERRLSNTSSTDQSDGMVRKSQNTSEPKL